MRPKIAIGGFHIESSSYNPSRSTEDDFEIYRGAELFSHSAFSLTSDYDGEFTPVFYAHALPGAPIDAGTYAGFKEETLTRLREVLPLDGVYLALHGAAFVAGMDDAEGDFVAAIRAVVGPDCPISVSYDLHGNVSQRVIDSIDMFSAYRTAPHIDVIETHHRALSMLMRAIETGVRPKLCWAPIPVSLPGERTSTEDEPARGLYAKIPAMEDLDGVWDLSLMVGYVWVDEPRVTAAAIVTGVDEIAMTRLATQMAQDYWDARDRFDFGTTTGSVNECIDLAMLAGPTPVLLADSGDNPTGGGAGDRVDLLRALIKKGAQNTLLAGIADLPATEAAFASAVGETVSLRIGGTYDNLTTTPLELEAEVVALVDGDSGPDRQAVLRKGGITFVLTARRRPFHNLSDFTALGLDPGRAQIVVVKSGYLSPEMKALAKRSVMALSPGIVDQAVERLPRDRTPRPMFPFDRDFDFEPMVVWSRKAL